MATKKKAKTAKPKALKSPPAKLIQELQATLEKHKWSGPIILKPATETALTSPCPKGKTPQEISFQRPDGTWVTKIICV